MKKNQPDFFPIGKSICLIKNNDEEDEEVEKEDSEKEEEDDWLFIF